MWSVAGPFEVGSLVALAAVLEAVRSQNNHRLFLAEEGSEVQIAAIVADFVVVVEGEEGMADEVEDSEVAEVASVVVVTTTGVVVGVAVGMAVADSGVYSVHYSTNRD